MQINVFAVWALRLDRKYTTLSAKCVAEPNVLGVLFVLLGVGLRSAETQFAKTPFSWFLTNSRLFFLYHSFRNHYISNSKTIFYVTQEPLNAPFLNGLFSSGFSRGKTAP